MIERRRGHIVAVSSTAGLFALPEAMIYTTSKMGVRGFMEALAMQLYHEGHHDYIKTSTVFPYFIDSNPYIIDVILKGCRQKVVFGLDATGRGLVEGVLREDEIITLPKPIALLYYM